MQVKTSYFLLQKVIYSSIRKTNTSGINWMYEFYVEKTKLVDEMLEKEYLIRL